MKRVRSITKPTGRKPMRVGAVLLKEVPYEDRWLIDVTWRGAQTPSGRGHKTFHNWRHAEEFAAKENKRLDALKEKGAGRYTFNDAADSYIKDRERISKLKDNTGCTLDSFNTLQGIVENHLRPKFGHMRLTEITNRMIKEWVIEQSQIAKPRTVVGRKTELSRVLNHAVEIDMLPINPLKTKPVKVPGDIDNRAKIPDRSDLEVLREYLNGPRPLKHGRFTWSCVRMVVVLAVSCGLRRGEASALTWNDIDPDIGEININKSRAGLQGLKGPKTKAGNRKIPTPLLAREIINEHAEVYKLIYGKCVGHVLRTRGRDYMSAQQVSHTFNNAMRACGLVVPGTNKIKFSHHKGRHYFASHAMKSTGDVHLVKRLMGHENASTTLDVYGHCLDDPEARAKIEHMPDWLATPLSNIDAPSATRPMQMPEPPRALPAPEVPVEQVNGTAVEMDCAIDIPSMAEPWVKPFVNLLAQGTSLGEAYDWVRGQLVNLRSTKNPDAPITLHTAYQRVEEEFKRLKLPGPKALTARLRAERILALHAQKHQVFDIARIVGCDRTRVYQVLRERGHNFNPNNPLNRKINLGSNFGRKPPPQHKTQLKLL